MLKINQSQLQKVHYNRTYWIALKALDCITGSYETGVNAKCKSLNI